MLCFCLFIYLCAILTKIYGKDGLILMGKDIFY